MTDQYEEMKPSLSIDQQIVRLTELGMMVDEQLAADRLARIGYYRLSGYWFLFQDKSNNGMFFAGTSFEQVINLYEFDVALRALLFRYTGIVEVAIRALVSNTLAEKYGPLAHMDSSNFFRQANYQTFIKDYDREKERQKEKAVFVQHNLTKYGELPIWAAVEILSLGTVSKLYGNIKSPVIKKSIAKQFDLEWSRLKNWLEVLTYIRNACAHHQRLYGRKIPLEIAFFDDCDKVDARTLSGVAKVLAQMLLFDSAATQDSFCKELVDILIEYRYVDSRRLGFPDNLSSTFDRARNKLAKREQGIREV